MAYLVQKEVTSKPVRVVAPAGACDCHSHVFGDESVYPYAENRSYTPPPATTAQYRRMLDTIGVERAVVVQPSVYGFDNRCTLDAVAEMGPERTRAVVMIDQSATATELRRMDEQGARGVRFITLAHGGAPLDQLQTTARSIAPLGWHVQMYVTPDVLMRLADTIRDLSVPVVLDHMAHVTPDASRQERDTVHRLLDTGKVWVKLSAYRVSHAGPPFADMKPVGQDYLRWAPDRCLWGSDWPHPNLSDYMPDDGDLLDLLADWAPDEELRRKVLTDNPARLYRF